MERRPVIGVLACCIFLHGCATQKAALPTSSEPGQLADDIGRKGEMDVPADEKPTKQTADSRWMGYAGTTLVVVGAVVLVVVGVVIYSLAKGNSGNNNPL